MDELHKGTRRLILDSRNLLETLESACTNASLDTAASTPVTHTLRENLARLAGNASTLRREVMAEPPSRRQVWKARLSDLDDQIAELAQRDKRCSERFRGIASEQAMRDDLLRRRGGAAGGRGQGMGGATVIAGMEAPGYRAGDEARRLDESGSLTGNIMNSGRETMQTLARQRDRLRGVRKRMLDVLHQAGVDRQIIARIERREFFDMMVVYALMAGMLLLLGLAVLWKYHRRRVAGGG